MKKGFTLVEVMASMFVLGMIVLGSFALLTTGLAGFTRANTDAELSSTNARSMRHVVENLRNASSVTVSSSGLRVDYTLPLYTNSADAVTGEKEISVPVQSDGVARAYVVDFAKGTMTDTSTNKVVLTNISSVDLDPNSTLYKKAYSPFQLSSVGSVKALTVNLITTANVVSDKRFVRFKTTVIGHNTK